MYRISQIASEYKRKLISADEAAALIRDGERISYGLGLSKPDGIDEAIGRIACKLHNVEIVFSNLIVNKPYSAFTQDSTNENIRFYSCHMTGIDRQLYKAGRLWFIPILLSELPHYWGSLVPIDKLTIQVGPMDELGNFNIGPQVSDIRGLIDAAKMVIVEVNTNMPRALGLQTELNISEVDYIVEGPNNPIPEIPEREITEEDEKIAGYIGSMIHDGCTIQLGIGGMPTAIGRELARSDIRDLSCHTELLSDPFVDMYEAGKITGNKLIDRGKMVYSCAGGTKRLYDFINNNQILYNAPVDYVNNIGVIQRINNFISINSCLNIDLFGQVNSESAGFSQISGTGGQLDFVHGAYLSPGGKSYICLHSTRKRRDGSMESLITPTLAPGTIVSTPRSAVQYIVTEYGVALLKGMSTWQRAEALINIAHPDCRDELINAAEKMHIWKNSNKLMP